MPSKRNKKKGNDEFPELGGRGHGRGQRVDQPPNVSAPGPSRPAQVPQQPPSGRPAQAPQQPPSGRPAQAPQQPPSGRPAQAPQQQQPSSRKPPTQGAPSTSSRNPPQSSAVVRSDGGNGQSGRSADLGRGSRRGNRAICDIVVTRPLNMVTKKGSTGTTISVMANYFKVNKKPEWNIYKYRVDFAPEIEETGTKKAIMRRQIERLGCFQFDGTMIFSPYKYQNDPMVLVDRTDRDEPLQINIRFVGELLATDAQYTHLLNIIMRSTIESLNMQKAYGAKGMNYFDAAQKIDIRQHNLQVWPGFCTAIRQHERDIMICTEVTHKVIRMENCYEVMKKESETQDKIKKALIGQVVVTEYSNATYRIDDVDFTQSPSSKFSKKSGEQITFLQYFRDRYNVTIRDTRQPLLVSRAKARDIRAGRPEIVNLIPELCRLTGLTDHMRANFTLMRDMAQHTRIGPEMRVQRFLELNRRLQNEEKAREMMKKWQMSLDTKLVEFPARVLNREIINFGGGRQMEANNADWTQGITRNPIFQSAIMKNWHCICTSRESGTVKAFLGQMMKSAREIGMNWSEPRVVILEDIRSASYIGAIEKACNDSTQLVMCIVPTQDPSRYSAIKKHAIVKRGVPSQVTLSKVLMKDRIWRSVAVKLLIQMNCKLGNVPWTIKIPASGIMSVGFDVTHDTAEKNRSYGALVASMDLQKNNSYFSTVSQHAHGEEMSNHLVTNMIMALRQYQTIHGEPPKRIIFYRDGVGEGDLTHVLEFEVKLLQGRLKEMYPKETPKLTFIIVTKRINTRIFRKNIGNAGNSASIQNPPPGTVVDDVITLPERYDFFLVSQATREGTISPTSYNVIFDESGFPADKIQQWTYKMTHLYYNWSGNVKVPAVCQYAHKLAFLVGQSLHQLPGHQMQNKLYFL